MHFEKIALTLTVLLLCIFSGTAFATPITSISTGTTCLTPSTVGAYSSNSLICYTGNADSWLKFSGFTNSSSADNMPVQALANAANMGFYYPENAGGPMSFQLGYNVQAFNETIKGVTLDVAATGSAALRAGASVTLNVCIGQAVLGCPTSQMMTVTLGADSAFPAQTLTFAATSMVGVSFTGKVDAGADLTQFESTIIGGIGGTGGDIPEPGTLMLMGLGLVAVATRLSLSRYSPFSIKRNQPQE